MAINNLKKMDPFKNRSANPNVRIKWAIPGTISDSTNNGSIIISNNDSKR